MSMSRLSYYRVIRIVQVEGSDRQAERVRLQLYASGLRCAIQRMRSREDYLSALKQQWPDVVLIGGGLPSLDALGAERLAMDHSPYLPIVFATPDHLAGLGLVILGAILQGREVRGRRVTDFAHAQAQRAHRERTRELPRLPSQATGTYPIA
jgi:chemotaxis response regulator CheB